MKIFLAALDDALADAWERHCGDLPGVTVHRGSILDLDVDAVVSPANSFGFMDGGIEERQQAVAKRLGFEISDHSLILYGRCRKPNALSICTTSVRVQMVHVTTRICAKPVLSSSEHTRVRPAGARRTVSEPSDRRRRAPSRRCF